MTSSERSRLCPMCSSAIPLSIFRITGPFKCPGCGAVLSVSQAYALRPVLSLIIAVGVAYWLEMRGVSLIVTGVILALPVNMVIIKVLRSWWPFSLHLSPEQPPAE